MDCFGTYFTHVQTCDNVRVQSATQWTVSVHILHMSKLVITFMFKVLRNGLLRYIPYTCQTCDKARVQSATQWIMLPPALAPVARPRPTRFHHVRCPGARAPANTLPSSSCHPPARSTLSPNHTHPWSLICVPIRPVASISATLA